MAEAANDGMAEAAKDPPAEAADDLLPAETAGEPADSAGGVPADSGASKSPSIQLDMLLGPKMGGQARSDPKLGGGGCRWVAVGGWVV